jgi:YVTN family beta-propeller protein
MTMLRGIPTVLVVFALSAAALSQQQLVKSSSTSKPTAAAQANPVARQQRALRRLGVVDLPGSPGFDEMAFAKGKLLITHTAASSLDIVDPARRRVIAQVVNLQSPRGLAVDQQNGKIYVAQAGNNSIAVIAFEGWQVTQVIPLQQPPTLLQLDDSGTRLYWASAQSNSLSILDLSTRQTIGRVDLGGRPSGMTWDSNRGLVFVALQDQAQVVAVDSNLQVASRLKLNASQPTSMVYDGRARRLYVAVRYAVLSISDQDGAESNRVAAPAGVDSLWLDPESRTLYAAAPGSLVVMRADNARLAAVDEIKIDIKGHNVAYDPDSRMVFLPGGREGRSQMMLMRPTSIEQEATDAQVR